MSLMRNLLLMGAAVSGLALLVAAPVSARTICREDGRCYNTSGLPVYDQPPYHRYAYAGDPDRYQRRRHYYHHDEER
jgi:hypothetical protein